MNSAAIILLTLIPAFVSKLSSKTRQLKIISYIWIVVVGTSRIVMGAHFASDVTVGIMLSLTLFEIILRAISKLRKDELTIGG